MSTVFTQRRFPALLLLLTLSWGLGCGSLGGTETGNPGISALDQVQPQDFPLGTEAGFILDTICAKLSQCNSELTLQACGEGMLPVTTIDTELGLTAGSYTNYRAIMEAESEGEIIPDLAKSISCRIELSALFCSSEEVQTAFDPNNPSQFDSAENIFSTNTPSCQGVY